MARWRPLLLGNTIEAPDLRSAEMLAAQRHGADAIYCISQLELEEILRERQIGNRRRAIGEGE